MARTAIYLHTIVQPGHRIELMAPAGMREGDEVDVVLLTDDTRNDPPRCFLDIIDSLPKGIGKFTSPQDVDAYVRHERDSWER